MKAPAIADIGGFGGVAGARLVTRDEYRRSVADTPNTFGFAVARALGAEAAKDGSMIDFRWHLFFQTDHFAEAMRRAPGDAPPTSDGRYFALLEAMLDLTWIGFLAHRGNGDSVDYHLALPAGVDGESRDWEIAHPAGVVLRNLSAFVRTDPALWPETAKGARSVMVCDGCHASLDQLASTGHVGDCGLRGRHQHLVEVHVWDCPWWQEYAAGTVG